MPLQNTVCLVRAFCCLCRHNFHQEQCLKADRCVTARGTHRLVPSSHQVFCSLHLEAGPAPGAEQEKTGGDPGRLTGLREFISPEEPPRRGILLTLYGFTEVNLNCDTLCFLPQIRSLLASVLKHLHFFSPIQRELLKQIQLCVSRGLAEPETWFFFFVLLCFVCLLFVYFPWDTSLLRPCCRISCLSAGYWGKLRSYPFCSSSCSLHRWEML